jgi:hypothetical protein
MVALQLSNPSYVPLYAAALTAVAGFLGSLFGAQIALLNFKSQRAFDKQLDWYERADKAFHDMIESIEIATTFQEEEKTPAEQLNRAWVSVQRAHLHIDRVAEQAPLFASSVAAAQALSVAALVQAVADDSEAFDPLQIKSHKQRVEVLELINNLPDQLRNARKPSLPKLGAISDLNAAAYFLEFLALVPTANAPCLISPLNSDTC